ncbi:MAG: GNAT family N-acetyltransferase [Dermatophilaceae bacterium]
MASSPPLPGLVVRRVTPARWQTYRDLRLASLLDSPRAFWTTYAGAADLAEADWRSRLEWPTWIASAATSPDPERPPAPVGLVALWHAPGAPEGEVVLVQMWVTTLARGTGVADALIRTALETARADGWSRVVLEVAEENGRAAGCYRRAGFRDTGRRAVMPWDPNIAEVEMSLDLAPLGDAAATFG